MALEHADLCPRAWGGADCTCGVEEAKKRIAALEAENKRLVGDVMRKHKALEKAEKLLKEWNHCAPSKRSAAGLEAVWAALAKPAP